MSSTIYVNQNPSPAVTRRSPISNADTGNNSQRPNNRRSLSDKLRNLFHKSSPSPNRTTNTDRRAPTTSVRQSSPSPVSGKSATEAPHLQAPTVNWPFGKKKSKPPSTPKTSKKKIKASQKTKQPATPAMEISNPIYQPENQTSIHDQYFTPRTPEPVYSSTGRLPSSSSSHEGTTVKGFRDYVVIDQSQQRVVPDTDVFTPPAYTSDRSRSSSMSRQRLPNTNTEYHFYHDNSTPTVSIPLADIEIIPTPQRKRKVNDTPPLSNTKILAEKPPISPQTSSRPPSSITTKPTQWKNSTSSSTLNNSGVHSTASQSMDVDVPKLNAPLIPFGSASSKKKSKRTKSQSRADGMTSSSSTINNLVQQNPINSNRPWTSTYGSLPDAEIIHGGSITSLKPSKPNTKKYPGITAIVRHHLRPTAVHYNERPFTTTTTITSPQRPQRFETSTTTLNEYEQNQPWSHPINNGSAPSTSSIHRHDGYIRPLTPPKPSVQPDLTTIRVDINDLRGRSPPPRPSRYDSPDLPAIYRSSTTIYTRDKHHYVNGGEIRTWSSQEDDISDDHNHSYKKPYAHIQVEHKREQQTAHYDQQVVPPKLKDNYDEYRYSPRAHEQEYYEKEQKIINDQEIQEEERYEVSYEYERQHQQYTYDTQTHYDELHSANRYSNDVGGDQNLTYSNLLSTAHSPIVNERDKIYDQSSRSYTGSERIQEPLNIVAPVNNSEQIPRTYTLKRSKSYDGLGISVCANSQSRLNHCIRDVEIASPGYHAGLRKNDRIISVNGINVENVDFSNVLILIKQGLDNDDLQLSVIHEPELN